MAWVIVLVFALLGVTPYLGLRTEGSLAMFSNLRTERGETNHFLVREPADLLGWTSDIVIIHESSDEWLAEMSARNYGFTYFELRERLARHPDVSLTFTRGTTTERILRAGDDPRFVAGVPRPLRMWVSFRPVDLGPHQRCLH